MSEINALRMAADFCRQTRDNLLRHAKDENWKLRQIEKMLADAIASEKK